MTPFGWFCIGSIAVLAVALMVFAKAFPFPEKKK